MKCYCVQSVYCNELCSNYIFSVLSSSIMYSNWQIACTDTCRIELTVCHSIYYFSFLSIMYLLGNLVHIKCVHFNTRFVHTDKSLLGVHICETVIWNIREKNVWESQVVTVTVNVYISNSEFCIVFGLTVFHLSSRNWRWQSTPLHYALLLMFRITVEAA
jgi:hypothetical protein